MCFHVWMSVQPFSTSPSVKQTLRDRVRHSLFPKIKQLWIFYWRAVKCFLSWDVFSGHEWHSHTVAVFCWAWPVNPFSWITWCSLTRSRSSWWLRRSDPCTCRLPPPHPSSLCWCPPRPQTVALSTLCRCQSRSRCRATTHSHRAPDSRTSLCTLALPPALDQVQSHFLFVDLSIGSSFIK